MPDWLLAGVRLTVFGMGLVFLLLALLWGLIALLLHVDRAAMRGRSARPAAYPAKLPEASGASAASVPSDAPPEREVVAAVMIAVRAHIRVRRKQAAPAMRAHQPGSLPSRWIGSGRTRQTRSWSR